jgi:hypothetical protein
MSTVRQIICWFASIDWTPEAITAAGTIALAFLTLVLTIGTLFLWLATRRLVRGSEKTAERQLRAYIFADNAMVIGVNSSNQFIQATFRNSGQTPAYNVTLWMSCVIAAYPLEIKPERTIEVSSTSKSHIGPGATFQTFVRPPEDATSSQMEAIRSGAAAFYIY